MTTMQRVAFFRLVGKAYSRSGIGDREVWRKFEMGQAIVGCHSVSDVLCTEDYDALMLHFAKLAEDFSAVQYWAVAVERRHRHVLRAISADLDYLRARGHTDAYMAGIYHQAGHPAYTTIDDIPVEHLHIIVQIADSYARRLRKAAGLRPCDLPSAGSPWRIRGTRAAELADSRAHRHVA
jgi:hypothetical protein